MNNAKADILAILKEMKELRETVKESNVLQVKKHLEKLGELQYQYNVAIAKEVFNNGKS